MSKYTIGSKVIKADSEGHGTIIAVMTPRRGRQLYKVNWGNRVSDEFEVNLMPDCDISDPFERCMSGIFGSYSEYSKKNTTFKIRNSNNSTISSLKASKTLFRAYQFKPLLKFLNSPNRRLLVADEVGLGKTIEAGHIMLELKARRELHHVLIVCPKSLREKWKEELAFKFGLQFKIYDSQKELLADIQEHRVPVHAILNYEKIRLKKKKEDDKNASDDTAKNIVDYLSENEFKFSLVLCDEAHKMRNKETQTYRGAKIIMSQADAAVFLTATPVMISTENLYNLLHLLDNTRYYNYQIFDNRLQENRPFIEALTDLNHSVPLKSIAKKLNGSEIVTRYFSDDVEIFSHLTTVGMAFADDAVYQEIMRLLDGEDTTKNRARLQYLISSMSMMNNIFSRTRKREVTTDLSQAERKPHMCKVVLTEREREEYDAIIEQYVDDNSYTDEWGEEKLTQGGSLGLVQKKRQVASSVFAYLNSETNLSKGIDEFAEYPDAKFEELIRVIDEVFKHGTKKIVIFALFRKTLQYLQIRFKKRGYGTLMIHGLIENRAVILDEFKNNPEAHILLSSEVGSEGLDMQFCNSMVNYDLPWNPMVVEQRIGRIDRFGQKSPIVNIYNLLVADSIQEDIYIRLLNRIGIFRGTIGDMEAILDAPIVPGGNVTIQDVYTKLERELYTSRLSDEERQRKFAEIELAIANEKENIQHLEEGLDNTLTNDAYFKDEIERIKNNNAYVTEIELKNYLESVIRQELSTCTLEKVDEHIYELKIPLSNPRILQNFLTQYQPSGEEIGNLFRQFKREIDDKMSIRMTFDQKVAYDNNRLLFMNIYHPIIQACLYYFRNHDDESKTSFCYALSSDGLLRKDNSYYLAVYQISVTRKVLGVTKHTETLLPLLYSVKRKEIVNDEELVSRVYSRSQTEGIEHNPSNEDIDNEMLQDMRYDFAETINEVKAQQISEIKLQMESDRQRNEKQAIEYYASIIDNQQRFIRGWESEIEMFFDTDEKRVRQLQGVVHLAKDRIKRYEKEREERLLQIREESQILVTESIVSLNLINII